MIDRADLAFLAKSLGTAWRQATDSISKRLDSFEQRLREIPAGPQGEKGERGDNGEPGIGLKGDAGDMGATGAQGVRGEQGIPGDRGEAGAAGPRGEKGEQGEVGIPGAPGAKGDRGERGEPGAKGEPGAPGISIKGDPGLQGVQGPQGVAGRDGMDGKDALDIRILDAIDETKNVPHGTFASHRGGLWTKRLAGWECIVNGIDLIEINQGEDFRSFSLTIVRSSGERLNKEFHMPVVLDRGVFKNGTHYLKGDGVTWGGSFWICQVDNPSTKPDLGNLEVSSDWRLSVKRGGDAFPSKNSEPKLEPVRLR